MSNNPYFDRTLYRIKQQAKRDQQYRNFMRELKEVRQSQYHLVRVQPGHKDE